MTITSIAQWLSAAREAKGWSMRRLADATGITQSYISQIESNGRRPSIEAIQKFAEALGADADAGIRLAFPTSDDGNHLGLDDTSRRLLAFSNNMSPEGRDMLLEMAETIAKRTPGHFNKGSLDEKPDD
jgi:transcriptional regulator with XRE-family HTH domain